MKRLNTVKEVIRYAATAVAVLSGIWLDKNVEGKLDGSLRTLMMGSLIVILFFGLEKVLDLLLGFKPIRKFVMGREDVEGWWSNIVYHRQTKQILFAGVTRVDYENSGYVLSGEFFNANGMHVGSFATTLANYESFCLTYRYEIQSSIGQAAMEEGLGSNHYIRHEGPPMNYAGFFFDPHYQVSLYVYGERLNKDFRTKLATREGRQNVALEFMNTCDEKFLNYEVVALQGGLATWEHFPQVQGTAQADTWEPPLWR
jgi:hypothetical protein